MSLNFFAFHQIKYLTFLVVILISLSLTSAKSEEISSENHSVSAKAMYIGGGLQLCSSALTEHCSDAKSAFNKGPYRQYNLSRENLTTLKATEVFQNQSESNKLKLDTAFQYFYANENTVDNVSGIYAAFEQALEADGGQFFTNLPDDIYFAIQDFTEITPSETPQFDISQQRNSIELLLKFIEEANSKTAIGEELHIAFITAAQRDAFAKVEYLRSLFSTLIAHKLPQKKYTVSWLPLDRSLAEALRIQKLGIDACDRLDTFKTNFKGYDRARVWPRLTAEQKSVCENPEILKSLIEKSHGLFFADGDTHSLLESIKGLESYIVAPLKSQVAEGKIFVAGNGAGAHALSSGVFAARPTPVITGGNSEVALIRGGFSVRPAPPGCEREASCPHGIIEDDLTFDTEFNLDLIPFGILDTQFSERNNMGRLSLLTTQSKTRFGVGIDEQTALIVSKTEEQLNFQVKGRGGVTFLDMRDAIFKSQSGKHQLIGLTHKLNHDDSASYNIDDNTLSINIAPSKQRLTNKTMVLNMREGEFRRQVEINCGMTKFHRWNHQKIAWLVNPGEDTKFAVGQYAQTQHCSYENLLFGVEN